MEGERRLQNLCIDSGLLLEEVRHENSLALKEPARLRQVLKAKNAQLSSHHSVMPVLGISFMDIEKSLESAQQSLRTEEARPVMSFSGTSYFHLGEQIKVGKSDNPAERYIQHASKRKLAEASRISEEILPVARRGVVGGLVRGWDTFVTRVMDAASSSPVESTGISTGPLLTMRARDGRMDSRRQAYAVQIYRCATALKGKPNDRSENHFDQSISEAVDFRRTMRPWSRLLPRPEQAKLLESLAEEMASLNSTSRETASIFLIIRDQIKGLDFQPRDSSISRESLASEVQSDLISASVSILESQFLDSCRSSSKRRRLEAPVTGSTLEALQLMLGKAEEFLASDELIGFGPVDRDSSGVPVWALLYFALRAGLVAEIVSFCSVYDGSLHVQVKDFARLLTPSWVGRKAGLLQGSELRLPGETDAEAFALGGNEEVFKRTLGALFAPELDIPDELQSEFTDYLWIGLFRARSAGSHQQQVLASLQARVEESKDAGLDDPLSLVQAQLLSLMYPEAITELSKNPSMLGEAASLAFICVAGGISTALAPNEPLPGRCFQTIPIFAEQLCPRMATEAVALFSCLESSERVKQLSLFFERQALLSTFFSDSAVSAQSLGRLKLLFSPPMWRDLLEELARNTSNSIEPLSLSRIRVLEELGSIPSLLDSLVACEFILIASMKLNKSELAQPSQAAHQRLQQLLNEKSNQAAFSRYTEFPEVVIATAARHVSSAFFVKKDGREALELMERSHMLEIAFEQLNPRVKAIYLELLVIGLESIAQVRQNLREKSLSKDAVLKQLRERLNTIDRYFYTQVVGRSLPPLPPYESYKVMHDRIKNKINELRVAL